MQRTSTEVPLPQAGFSGDLNEEDQKKLTTDAVFYILAQEKKRHLLKKADIFKAIALTGRSRALQEEIWSRTLTDLKHIFGYELTWISTDKSSGGYVVINSDELSNSSKPKSRHLVSSDEEDKYVGLLSTVLALIYMNKKSIKQDELFNFLQKLKVWDEGSSKREKEEGPFGNVKNLIEKEWCQKQHYIKMEKDETADPENPRFIYLWGERAKKEVKEWELLKFVAEIYDKKVSDFTEEYEAIIDKFGEEIFMESDPDESDNEEILTEHGAVNHEDD